MVKIKQFILVCLMFVLLTGCLYPDEQRSQEDAAYEEQLRSVQEAVVQYRQNTSGLPVKMRDSDTPEFRQYPVNFAQLVPEYLQSPPGNSFESGGVYQYVLVNPEEIPEVKLIDLRTVRVIQELERRIFQYRSEHDYAPVEGVAGHELLEIDYSKLNYDEEPVVESPFHPDHRLPLLMQTDGSIVIDYSLDINYYVDEYGLEEFDEGDDLRWLLVEHSAFVPAYSLPQTVEDGDIVYKDND